MYRLFIISISISTIFLSCESTEPIADPDNSEELVTYPVKISNNFSIDVEPLENGRISAIELDPTYFFIGVYDAFGQPYFSQFGNDYVYACGGFNYLPTDLNLNLYTNRTYHIIALAMKKSNGFGLARSTYDFNGVTYERLHTTWAGNPTQPSILTDSMSYSNLWLTEGQIAQFDNGYMYSDEDSISLNYRWPYLANTYLTTKTIETTEDLTEITLDLERKVFGVTVQVEGLTATRNADIRVGSNLSDPIRINPETNDSTFVFAITQPEWTEFAPLGLRVSEVNIANDGTETKTILFHQDFHSYPINKNSLIKVSLSESEGRSYDGSVQLVEVPLTQGDTVLIGF